MAQCPTCGSPVPDNADVCPDCGMDLQAATPPPVQPMQPQPVQASLVQPPQPPPLLPPAPADSGAMPANIPDFSFEPPPLPSSSFSLSEPAADERTVVIDPSPVMPPAPAAVAPPVAAPAPTATAPTATLTLKRGGALTSEVFLLGSSAIVGRFDPESGPVDVDMGPLPEASYVSRHHVEVRCDGAGQWFVRDMGSRNGTFVRAGGQGQFGRVNGEQPINDGDEISLGNARFEFHTGS